MDGFSESLGLNLSGIERAGPEEEEEEEAAASCRTYCPAIGGVIETIYVPSCVSRGGARRARVCDAGPRSVAAKAYPPRPAALPCASLEREL